MRVSVIILTYRRVQTLLRALQSLQQQALREVDAIVVDNAAEASVEQAITEFNRTARVPARYVAEPHLGLHNARHAGARAAVGDLLVFSDDDATFDPGWLEGYVRAFAEHPEMVAAGGPVRPVWETLPPTWLLDFMGNAPTFGLLSLMEPYREFRLTPEGFFYGVNMAIRREVLFEAGGFNPDAFGDAWLGDGETGLNRKLWQRGALIGYVPAAIVYHHIPPARMTRAYLRRRMSNEGACTEYAQFHDHIPGVGGLSRRAASIVFAFLRPGLTAFVRMAMRRERFACLKTQLQFAYNLSRLRYVLRLFHDQRFRELVTKKNWLEAPVDERDLGRILS